MPHAQNPGKVSHEMKDKEDKSRQGAGGPARQVRDVEERPQANEDQRSGNAREDADDNSRKGRHKEEF